MDDDPDLSLVSTKALTKELFRRCDHAVLAYLRASESEADRDVVYQDATGNPFVCLGLCVELQTYVRETRDAKDLSGEPDITEDP